MPVVLVQVLRRLKPLQSRVPLYSSTRVVPQCSPARVLIKHTVDGCSPRGEFWVEHQHVVEMTRKSTVLSDFILIRHYTSPRTSAGQVLKA